MGGNYDIILGDEDDHDQEFMYYYEYYEHDSERGPDGEAITEAEHNRKPYQ